MPRSMMPSEVPKPTPLYDQQPSRDNEFAKILRDKKARIKHTSEQPANFFENRPTPGVTAGGPGSGRYPKGSHQDIGETLSKKIGKNWDGAVKYYNSIPNTDGGRILNTDEARELSSAYRADRTRSAEVHEPASQFIKDLYAHKLSQPTPAGYKPVVLFTAGGTGAGKSVSLRAADPQDLASKAEIVYDTNMNNVPSATAKINQALSAGRNVRIAYTYRDPVEAMTGGALPRAMRMGRTVPLAEHIKTHVGAYATVSSLQKIYADNPNVQFRLFDNSRGPGNAAQVLTVDDLPKMADNGLEGRLHEALNQARTSGRISEAVYQGTLGKGLGRAVGSQSESKRVSGARAGTARSSTVSAGGPGSGRYPKGSGKQNGPVGRAPAGRDSGGVRDGAGGSDLYRDRRIQAAYQVKPDQASLARLMGPGCYRVVGDQLLTVTKHAGLARSFADRMATGAQIVQVYNGEGRVIYAKGGGI